MASPSALLVESVLNVLLLSLLLLPLPMPHTSLAVFPRFRHGPFQNLHPDAHMVLIVAGEVAVRAPAVDLVLAVIRHELEVAHDACFACVVFYYWPGLSIDGQLSFTAISMRWGRGNIGGGCTT